MKNLIQKILKESEDEFEWLEIRSDIDYSDIKWIKISDGKRYTIYRDDISRFSNWAKFKGWSGWYDCVGILNTDGKLYFITTLSKFKRQIDLNNLYMEEDSLFLTPVEEYNDNEVSFSEDIPKD